MEVRGGGKGRAAYYTVPDQLFLTWYQMRYLRPHRRRIELFVEVLRVWFEEDQRLRIMKGLADCPGVMESEGTPAEQVGKVLFNRALSKRMQRDIEGAIADFLAAAREPEADREVRALALAFAYRIACEHEDDALLDRVSRCASEALGPLGAAEHAAQIEGVLLRLASSATKSGWPRVVSSVSKTQPAEVIERLEFFRPAAEILQTGDLSRLDPLPPEQRDFVQEVLQKFSV